MSDAPSRMNKSATCTQSDTELAREGSRKVLAKLADNYEATSDERKEMLGLMLRRNYANVVNAEDRV